MPDTSAAFWPAFEKAGLVEKTESPNDARQTLLGLTRKGRKAFEPLNARSNRPDRHDAREAGSCQASRA